MKYRRKKRLFSFFSIVSLFIGLISAMLYIAGRKNAFFAEWLVNNVGHPVRVAMANLTGRFNVSLAEVLIYISPLIAVFIIASAAKKKNTRERIKFLISLLSVLSILWSSYVFTLGMGYFRTYISSRMNIGHTDINEENLYDTLVWLKEESEALLPEIEFLDSGSSFADISFDEICEEVCLGYERLNEDFPSLCLEAFDSSAKPVLASKALTYLEILGIYTFFTGESNVNVHYPDYTLPMTIAHEFAHQRGISRENEANFIAFLVCIRADSPYVRYSGYVNMFEYVASAMAKTNKILLLDTYDTMDARMYGEMRACTDFYYANRIEFVGKISNFFNDNYLKSQGTEGVVSYGMVVELCVDYYCNE